MIVSLKHYVVIKYMMQRPILPACCLCVLLAGAWGPALVPVAYAAAQATPRATVAQLERLRRRIDAVGKALSAMRGRHARVEAELRRVERGLAEAAKRRRAVEGRLAARRDRLARFRARRRTLEGELVTGRHALVRQIRAAYVLGGQPRFKLLLNQQDPAQVGRTLVYFDYLNRARTEEIETVERRMRALAAVRREIVAQVSELDALRAVRLRQERDFERRRAARRAVLARLAAAIHGKGAELAGLKHDEARLRALLGRLQKAVAGIPAGPGPRRPFARLKGRLAWPTQGRIVARFGTPRLGSLLKWRGVVIDAQPGRPVRAIAYGRVVFADWLRGFGLLLIIDHGDGYMSLYGHNQSLYKETGDWVTPGEVVATVGDSGGEVRPGLYFEIRHDGRPVNPARWCRAGVPRHLGATR
jgi:septal ring factor EnvC (AmiA/AmiB activator)